MSWSNSMLPIALVVAIYAVALVSSDISKNIPCCTKVSRWKDNKHHLITEYQQQEEALPCVHAIIFFMQDGRILCSNPKAKWVKEKIKELDSGKPAANGNRR